MSQHRADGRFFHGTELHNGNEVANVEFGKAKFTAHVKSRRAFSVYGTRAEVTALHGQVVRGQYAPLTVAAEHLGNAQLEEISVELAPVECWQIDLVFVHGEYVPR